MFLEQLKSEANFVQGRNLISWCSVSPHESQSLNKIFRIKTMETRNDKITEGMKRLIFYKSLASFIV